MRRFEFKFDRDPVWSKLSIMMAVMFFLYLGDSLISDFMPGYMQAALGGSLAMGLMMSFSSIIGFAADLIFPQFLKSVTSRKLVLLAISTVFLTAGGLMWTTHFTYPAIFLFVMGVWGVYYELLHFGISSFVINTAAVNQRSGVWSIIGVTKSLAYCIGPLMGSWLLLWKGNVPLILAYALFGVMAYVIWTVVGIKINNKNDKDKEMEVDRFNIGEEIGHWVLLFDHVWPILLVSVTLRIVDASFWTTGVVMSDYLTKANWLGSLLLPAYILPSIFIGFLVAKWGVAHGKKKISEVFMLFTGIAMIGFGLTSSVFILIAVAFVIGILTSVAWPMVDAVYSDISNRMGREQKHMMGLSSSTVNLSYIVGPVVAGFMSEKIGEAQTLMWIGVFVVLVSTVLLFVTPKKLKLPQKDINTWN